MARGILRLVIRVVTSHRTEVLLDAFVRAICAERERQGAFAPLAVVVPNSNVEAYLRLGVAERLGIAANLETTFLRKFLAGLALRAVPEARVIDAEAIEGHLLALLHDDALLAGADLAQVRGYLLAAGADRDAVDRRRCQLAEVLARLFDEYAGSRPEMLEAWKGGGRVRVPGPELWQRALWLAIFGPGGRLERRAAAGGVRWLSLAALWEEAVRASPASFAGRTVHVFGLSYIATAYHRMLARLARESEIHVYTLNPCREEADELRRGPDPASDDPYRLGQTPHLALRLWARPGRENLRLLLAQGDAKLDAYFPEREPTTLLHRLQDDIVAGQTPDGKAPPAGPDDSLRVLPCPSPRRELEVVAAEIWGLLRKDSTLRACDVGVIVPEAKKELYLAQLPAVFGESCELPHGVADVPAAGGHRVAQAIELLVELPFSTFTRKDFLPLLTHPCLMARFPSATPAAWRELAATLGIVRGADRKDFDPAYLTHDLFSWDQGLCRLALGAVADAPNPEARDPMVFGGDGYLPGPSLESDKEAQLGFGLLARSLIADAAFASGHGGQPTPERPLGEWLDFLCGMVRSYLVLDQDDGAGQTVVASFLAALDGLSEIGLEGTPVSYRVAATLAKRALGAPPRSPGHYLASGVTVASFVPMRAIPFRAVFVLGLGQDGFPRPAARHELDLREGVRLAGDVDEREQDLYMFLETLLSARDHIVFSYVSRDEITGDELPASPALLELRSILGRGYVDRERLASLFRDERADQQDDRPSLRRYDDTAARREVLPAAEAEHRAKELGQLVWGGTPGPASARKRLAGLPAQLRSPLGRVLGLPALAVGKPPEPAAAFKIPLAVLRRFLEDPLQGSAAFSLGMVEDDDEGLAEVEDEPFDTDKLLLASLVRGSMSGAILAAQGLPTWEDLDATHVRQSLAAELAGQSPTGLFRTAGAGAREKILRGWHQELPKILGKGRARCRAFRFVANLETVVEEENEAAARPETSVAHRPAPSFEIAIAARPGEPERAVTVTVVGETGLWASAKGATDSALSFTTRKGVAPDDLGREDLRAFLDYVVLTASDGALARPGFRSALGFVVDGSPGLRTRAFGRLTAERSRNYLGRLCAQLLAGGRDGDGAPTSVHPYLLPHEAVFASRRNGTAVNQEIEKLCQRDDDHSAGFSSQRGPVREVVGRYAPPSAADAERMAEERFGLFFELAKEQDV